MSNSDQPLGLGCSEGLGPLLDSEEDPARLWAEIHRLRAEVEGPAGYANWQDAATAERLLRKATRSELRELQHWAMRALVAWDGTVLPKAHDGMMQERMEDLRANLRA